MRDGFYIAGHKVEGNAVMSEDQSVVGGRLSFTEAELAFRRTMLDVEREK